MPRAPARGSPSARAPSAARGTRAPVARPHPSAARGSRAPVARPSHRLEPARERAPSALAPHARSAETPIAGREYAGGGDPPGNCVRALVAVSESIRGIRARAPARDRSTGSELWRISHCRHGVPGLRNMSELPRSRGLPVMSEYVRICPNCPKCQLCPIRPRRRASRGQGRSSFPAVMQPRESQKSEQ